MIFYLKTRNCKLYTFQRMAWKVKVFCSGTGRNVAINWAALSTHQENPPSVNRIQRHQRFLYSKDFFHGHCEAFQH